jgi:hypothetical protein
MFLNEGCLSYKCLERILNCTQCKTKIEYLPNGTILTWGEMQIIQVFKGALETE